MIRIKLTALLLAGAALATAQTDPQKRGHELFINSPKGKACATCHELAGEGTAVGPDLRNLAGAAMPAGIKMAILATSTAYVVLVKLDNGTTFPAMKIKEDAAGAEFWDLSKMPPEVRKVAKKDIDSVQNNNQWKHPPESTGYTDAELADLVAYLRYAAKAK
jgi:cytochrome c peroxidase